MAFTTNRGDYDRISVVLNELADEGFDTPDPSNVRRWALAHKIRAYRIGSNRLLVNRDDVRRMVIPTPVGER